MSAFQKRHYEMIAGLIKSTFIPAWKTELLESFCKMFKEDNPHFNRTKFLIACGVTYEP
jgi:hypothetical protein